MDLVAAVDLGGTKIAAGLVDRDGIVLKSSTAPTPGREGPDAVLAAVVRLVCGLGGDPVAAGVGSAGVIDADRGVVVSSTDVLPDWAGTDLRGRLAEVLGLPVAVDNDIHAHALGEQWRGAAQNVADLLFVAVGTGIGASLVLGGRVRRGAHRVAGHAGHVPVAAASGIPCTCGATGHLEAVASGPAMLAAYRATAARAPTGHPPGGLAEVDRRARAGDRDAIGVLAAGAGALGSVLGGLVNTVDPELAVVGGGVAGCGEHWWRALRSAFAAELLPAVHDVPLVPAALAADGALIGAARLAWEVVR